MPFETRLFVKTGMVYLVLTFAAGAALVIFDLHGRQMPFIIGIEHGHLGFVGWLVNMVIGVALWMFPLDRRTYPETSGRYPTTTTTLCYALLNIGLPLRVITEPWYEIGGGGFLVGILLMISGLMQFASILLFVAIVWRRVRRPSNPAPGVR